MVARRLAALLLALATAAFPAAAQQVVTSPAADSVSVSVYRDPERSADEAMELDWLEGYALITETRTVDLPAGESVIRFEGVAGSMLPVSVAVSGLPRPPAEKNYDARLLSPGALIDASLGGQVRIRRTSRATGRTTETDAILRSGPNGIVLQTAEGVEALRCTGLNETLVHAGVPAGLADKPTLTLRTSSPTPRRATVQLSYLAGQFDWQADYVAHLGADGRSLDLFAWLTLANGNDESFPDAQAQAIAGDVERDEDEDDSGASPLSPEVHLRCWPAGNTGVPSDPPPPAPPAEVGDVHQYEMTGEEIVVTGARIRRPNLESASPVTAISAEQENLGDLKLYRIPIPVTVAANAQKQVALLSKSRVPVERIYGRGLEAAQEDDEEEPSELPILLRMRNLKDRGLGLPLPAGRVALFEQVDGWPMLLGEIPLRDHAVGEEVELDVGTAADVTALRRILPRNARERARDGDDDDDDDGDSRRKRRFELTVANAGPAAAHVELELWTFNEERLVRPSRKLGRKNGSPVWRVVVPSGGEARLQYTIRRERLRAPEGEEGED